MKQLKYLVTVVAVASLFTSCNSFLDTQNLTQATTANYPQTVDQAKQVLSGIYNTLSLWSANPHESFIYASQLASDDCLGGGGAQDYAMQAEDLLMYNSNNKYANFWADTYKGIHRANLAIETLGNCTGYTSDDQKNQMLGEAYFLRAYYYYELASMFENIPLTTSSVVTTLPQSTPDATWSQIISDLKQAITLMPAKKFGSGWVEAGHVDHWTAEAMMGRAFLFYTGFYSKTDVTLPDNSKVTKDNVITWIDECATQSGYSLTSDYRNLWAYTNRLTVDDYAYTKGKGLKWVENDNAINPESMFAIKYSKFADWGTTIGYSNGYALHFGMRGDLDYSKSYPFGNGWGAGPVAPNLWSDWVAAEPSDIRRTATICNIPNELTGYTRGGGSWKDFVQETDYYDKKWSPILTSHVTSTSKKTHQSFDAVMYSFTAQEDNMQLWNIHDLVLIRFADVLLMQSELKSDVSGINQVRSRAGLPSIATYSLAALQNERRWEFACEAVRWNDIRRWHIAADALDKQSGQPTFYKGNPDTNTTSNNGGGYKARYNATNGFFPIPDTEISLSSGLFKQNAGWGTSAANYSGWK